MFMAESASGTETNLKNTNIGDIKHKWEYFQSQEPFYTRSPEDGFIEL